MEYFINQVARGPQLEEWIITITMDEEHRSILRKKRMLISQNISEDILEKIISFLVEEDIFSIKDTGDIIHLPKPSKRVEKLLDLLPKRGREAFQSFKNALKIVDMADLLTDELQETGSYQ